MKKTAPRILIVGKSDDNAEILRQLKKESLHHSAQVLVFDQSDLAIEKIYDSTYPHHNYSHYSSVVEPSHCNYPLTFNTDPGSQLANALVQEYERGKDGNILLFHDNLHANQMLWNLLQNHLVEQKIDLIVFFNWPTALVDLLLYQVAKALRIETLILTPAIFPKRFFSLRSLHDFGDYETFVEVTKQEISHLKGNTIPADMTQQKSTSRLTLANAIKVVLFLLEIRSIKLFDPVFVLSRARHLHDAPPNRNDWRDPFAKFFFQKKHAYFEFITQDCDITSQLQHKYVYFPLQPLRELYSEILLNQFSDQLLAIEQLSRFIPSHYKIMVKDSDVEHSDYLTPMFFHRLRRISNVVHIPRCMNTQQLLENCEIFATVNSQLGWNALNLDKKVLVFGKPWYWKFPGVHIFKNELSYEEVVESHFTNLEVNDQINILFSKSHDGNLHPDDMQSSAQTHAIGIEKNAEIVANQIIKLIFNRADTSFRSSERMASSQTSL